MVRDVDRAPVLNPYEKRLRETDRKLREALDRLVKGTPRDASLQERRYELSVASLAREAGVARNAIYTNHRAMIDALRQAAQQRVVPRRLENWEDKLAQQRAVIDVLKTEQRRLVTENAALLKRAVDAEAAAARHQRQNARLLKERDDAHRPVVLLPRPGQ
jgi:chromosome segregation ATPase